jgi:VanZ family protein
MIGLTNRYKRRLLQAALMSLIATLLLMLHFSRPPAANLFQQSLFEASHVPIFGIIAISLLFATPKHWRTTWKLATAMAIAIGLGLISESAQIPIERDASFSDLISNALGAAGFLAIAIATKKVGFTTSLRRISALVVGLILLLCGLSQFIGVSAAYVVRNWQFPVLIDFDSPLMNTFVTTQNSTLESGASSEFGRSFQKVRLRSGYWPGLIFHDIRPDWRKYSALAIDLALNGPEPLDINIRVHDRRHSNSDQLFRDRFNRSITISPGEQTLRISLVDIRNAPMEREMNLAKIDGIVIFCDARNAGREFYIAEIRLE